MDYTINFWLKTFIIKILPKRNHYQARSNVVQINFICWIFKNAIHCIKAFSCLQHVDIFIVKCEPTAL
jgi:hypothetical protein